jgi:hypothetical protein
MYVAQGRLSGVAHPASVPHSLKKSFHAPLSKSRLTHWNEYNWNQKFEAKLEG